MARVKKTLSEREDELKKLIDESKKKLSQLQLKQKTAIGELAIKHDLHKFDLKALDSAFKKLSAQLQSN